MERSLKSAGTVIFFPKDPNSVKDPCSLGFELGKGGT